MYELFKARAERAGAEVHRFTTKAEAEAYIVDLFQKEQVRDETGHLVVWADCPFLDEALKERVSTLPGMRFTVSREDANAAWIGISQVDGALAEIGTLVQDATAIDKRLVSMLPEVHLAILSTKTIVADMPAWIAQTDTSTLGSYMSMITGPSRTADIERVLTIGVHGPRRLVVCCVDEMGGVA
ncbi:MAG: lactate utilization protein [Desulfobulbaceae bacterium]|jgi:L-lactate dehydrogenase complex protein LldG|nr:lactate utilization protein [Desulfobulbaceae bacterium]